MFGAAQFGKSYFGGRYFGPASSPVPPQPPAPEIFDVSSVSRTRISKDDRQRRLAEQRAAEQEALRTQVMAAVEAEKMAAAMRAEQEIAPPEPTYTAVGMLPVKFRGRK